jgi:hypothetical protein
MATTCRDIVHLALRKIGVLRAGKNPTAGEAADVLASLQGFYNDYATTIGLTDVLVTEDYEAKEFERVFADAASNVTITIPETIEDADTGDDRQPKDLALIVVAIGQAGQEVRYLYDGNAGAWVSLNGLTLASNAPLASRGSDGLACCLAELIADEFGGVVGPVTMRSAARFRSGLTHRFSTAHDAAEYY